MRDATKAGLEPCHLWQENLIFVQPSEHKSSGSDQKMLNIFLASSIHFLMFDTAQNVGGDMDV